MRIFTNYLLQGLQRFVLSKKFGLINPKYPIKLCSSIIDKFFNLLFDFVLSIDYN